MRKLKLSNLAFWLLAAVCVTMLVAMVLVVGGAIPIDSPSEPVEPEPQSAPAAVAKPRPRPTHVVVTAARGESWISVRVGSENGTLLDERVLAQSSSVRFQATGRGSPPATSTSRSTGSRERWQRGTVSVFLYRRGRVSASYTERRASSVSFGS